MNIIIDYIGIYAPIMMMLVSGYNIYNKNVFFTYFYHGVIFTTILNILLKMLFKEPRPNSNAKNIELAIKYGEFVSPFDLGMPSGHMQNCFFVLIYIFLVTRSYPLFIFNMVLTIISMYQRYMSNNHTILQLFVGALIGLITAIIIYNFAELILNKSKTFVKDKDDKSYISLNIVN